MENKNYIMKRVLASLLVVVLLLSSAPLSGLVGLELRGLTNLYATTASAATISLNRPLDKVYSITAREYYSSGKYHGGIDYGCPRLTPVYAAESGTVTLRDGGYGEGYSGCSDGNGWGNYADIAHDAGYTTRYAHMTTGKFSVKSGDKVQRGQLIGYSGNSGNSTGPHLHFGLYLNGNKVYPEPYLDTATGYHNGSISAPTYSKLSIDTTSLYVGETITFTADSDTADHYTIGINRNGTRILTKQVPHIFYYTCTEAGSYTAYVSAVNDGGYIDSNVVGWDVYENFNCYDFSGSFRVKASSKVVRTGPASSYGTVKTIYSGDIVSIVGYTYNEYGNLWYKTDSGNYIFHSYLEFIDGSALPASNYSPAKMRVECSSKRVFDCSSGSSEVLRTISRGSVQNVVGYLYNKYGNLMYLLEDGGYVFSNYFSVVSSDKRMPSNYIIEKMTVKCSEKTLRVDPYSSSDASGNVSRNDVVTIDGYVYNRYGNLWYMTSDEKFLFSSYLEPASQNSSAPSRYGFKSYLVKNEATKKRDPYAVSDTDSKLSKYSTVNVTGYLTNLFGNKWYMTEDGYYIYNDEIIENSFVLDVNGLLDSVGCNNVSNYGTFDVYINGSRVANDVTDYYVSHAYGTTYAIQDIKATTGHTYNGLASGSASGTIGDSNKEVKLSFSTNKYTVVFKDQNGTTVSTQRVTHGSNATAPAALNNYYDDNYHYTFIGWSGYTNITSNKTITATFSKASHVWNLKSSVDATCMKEGTKVYTCSCGKTLTETSSKNPKNHVGEMKTINQKAATCVTAGYTGDVCCDQCNAIATKGTIINPTGEHLFGDWKTTKEENCTDNGAKERVCSVCGKIENAVIPALGHDYATTYTIDNAATCTENGSKSRHCSHCDAKTDVAVIPLTEHSYMTSVTKPATCAKSGIKTFTCTCGDSHTEAIPATGHTEVTDKAAAATCSKTGLTEGKHCSVCNAVITSQTIIPETGHTIVIDKAISATCTKTGLTEGKHCSVCGEVLTAQQTVAKTAHTNSTATTPATTAKDGKTVTACTVCGKVESTVVIPKASSIKLSATSYTYNGKVKTPTVTVKDSKGNTLKNGTDYTVSYASGRKNTGKYVVTVTLQGNYTGSKNLNFTILPGKTASLTATQTTTSVKATWKAVTGASGYQVILYSAKNKALKTVYTTKTTASFTKLSKGTTYKVKVTAYKTIDGKKATSSVSSLFATATKPGTPTLTATAGTKKAALKWNKQTGATGYVVYMATTKSGKYTKAATLKGNSKVSYTKTGLTKGKTYYFKVCAYTTVGGKTVYGAASAVKAVKVK